MKRCCSLCFLHDMGLPTDLAPRIGALLLAAGIAAGGAVCPSTQDIRQFITKTWITLRRSNAALLKSVVDSKVSSDAAIVYVPSDSSLSSIRDEFKRKLTP